MFIDPAELATEVLLAQETGRASDRLGGMLHVICDGVWFSMYRNSYRTTREDDVATAVWKMLRLVPRMDPAKGAIHSFVITITKNVYHALRRDERTHLRKCLRYAEDRLGYSGTGDPLVEYIRSLPPR